MGKFDFLLSPPQHCCCAWMLHSAKVSMFAHYGQGTRPNTSILHTSHSSRFPDVVPSFPDVPEFLARVRDAVCVACATNVSFCHRISSNLTVIQAQQRHSFTTYTFLVLVVHGKLRIVLRIIQIRCHLLCTRPKRMDHLTNIMIAL